MHVEISKDYKEGDIDLDWQVPGLGFGHLAFYEKDGKVYCNNETKSREFVKSVLCKLVDIAIFDDNQQQRVEP